MSELILTDEEKALPFWNDLDDSSLGRVVKHFGVDLNLKDLPKEEIERLDIENLMLKAAIIGMCNFLRVNGYDEYTGTITGLQTADGIPSGDWEVMYRRIRSKADE